MSSFYSYYCHSKNCHHRNGDESLSIEALEVLYKDIKVQKCAKCSSSFYCSKGCQLYDWENGHKRKCQLTLDHRNAIYNDPNVKHGHVPGATYTHTSNSGPARSVEEYVLKQYNPRDGHEVKSISKSKKILNKFPQVQQQTYELMVIIVIKVILSDLWDRVEKKLPPRPIDFLYQFGIDMIIDADDEELVELWMPQVLQFKSWCWRSSSEGRLFEFPNVTAAKISTINKLLERLIEWEPQSPDDNIIIFGSILAAIVSGLANQQYYLLQILNPQSPLNKYVDILISWSHLNLPSDHFWHASVESMINGLLVGVEFSQTFFDSINPSLLVVLKPVFERLVHLMSERRNLEQFQSTNGDNLQIEVNKFKTWRANAGGRNLKTIQRALKYVSPDLNISSIRFLWLWQKDQVNKFINKYPGPQLISVFSEEIDVYNDLESIYQMNT